MSNFNKGGPVSKKGTAAPAAGSTDSEVPSAAGLKLQKNTGVNTGDSRSQAMEKNRATPHQHGGRGHTGPKGY
jgi:hypothetical protein